MMDRRQRLIEIFEDTQRFYAQNKLRSTAKIHQSKIHSFFHCGRYSGNLLHIFCAFFLTENHFSFCDFCDIILFGKATSVLFQSKSNNEEKFQ